MTRRHSINWILFLSLIVLGSVSSYACDTAANFGSSLTTLPMNIMRTVVQDASIAYSIDSSSNKFKVLDITGSQPTVTTELTIHEGPALIDKDGDHVYILHNDEAGANMKPNLTVINVANPASPIIVHDDDLDVFSTYWERSLGLAVSNGHLWVLLDSTPYGFDVSDPTDPVRYGWGYNSGLYAIDSETLKIVGDYVYVAGSQSAGSSGDPFEPSIDIYHVNPADNDPYYSGVMEPITSQILTGLPDVRIKKLAAGKGAELFVSLSAEDSADDYSAIQRYSCGATGALTLEATLSATDDNTYHAFSMASEGNYLYVRADLGIVRAVDITDWSVMTEVANVTDSNGIYGYLTIFPLTVVAGTTSMDRICDGPTIYTSLNQASLSPGPVGGTSNTWHFTWYTERWTDPSLDRVYINASTQSPASCDLGGTLDLNVSNSRVETSVEYDASQGLFRHHLSYWRDDCEPCTYFWVARSFRSGIASGLSGASTFRIYKCFATFPPPMEKSNQNIGDAFASLAAPSPNPFNPKTTLRYHVPSDARNATLTVHDLSGRVVRRLVTSQSEPGWHEVSWQGRDEQGSMVPSGVYFARLETGSHAPQVQKLVLLK